MNTRTDHQTIITAIQAARRVLAEYIEPGQPRDATVTVDRLRGLLDNRDVEAALKRIDVRNTFELVSVET
ncbi:hypothetical protein OZ411_01410 [Bradyrhizobium sp. Arg237L]|uniref:hypothetical protein n=1 Tax=Bradyrhizobium sp. Arg237L TaxID=3003352 RepID=UPI00249DFFEA|nr:hypothetical protein [Bradyrhizobium sp. Arg237L]MDI4231471.1 hypothetical protein [Bradyrhizobium sp. Arg237L]